MAHIYIASHFMHFTPLKCTLYRCTYCMISNIVSFRVASVNRVNKVVILNDTIEQTRSSVFGRSYILVSFIMSSLTRYTEATFKIAQLFGFDVVLHFPMSFKLHTAIHFCDKYKFNTKGSCEMEQQIILVTVLRFYGY